MREMSHIYSSAEILTPLLHHFCLFIYSSIFCTLFAKKKKPEPVNVKQSEVMRRCSEQAGIAVRIFQVLTSDHLPSGLYSF